MLDGSMTTEQNIQIKTLADTDYQRWDKFVEDCPAATFFHRSGWQDVIRQGFGHKTHFLYAEIDGVIQGVLPLAHIRSFLFGHSLISLPFCDYGGVVANSEAVSAALIKAACEIADSLTVDYLELRHQERLCPNLPVKNTLHVKFRKEIDPDPEVNMKAIPRKQRAMVRKGIQAGLKSEIDQQVDRFYIAFSESVRNLGTPVYSYKYFQVLKSVFKDDCEILTITKDDKLVASVMSFYFRDEVLAHYSGDMDSARDVKGRNDFKYWELMRRAAERGIRIFDFGRSKVGTGQYSYKKNWGFEPQPLNYEYYLVKTNELPDINPLNPKYQLFIKLWKRLPLPVSRFVGPFISGSLG